MAPTENTRRKARVSGVEKYIKKYGSKLLFQYGPPVLRYSLVPGMILYAMYYTEPDPTLMDMLWPLPIQLQDWKMYKRCVYGIKGKNVVDVGESSSLKFDQNFVTSSRNSSLVAGKK